MLLKVCNLVFQITFPSFRGKNYVVSACGCVYPCLCSLCECVYFLGFLPHMCAGISNFSAGLLLICFIFVAARIIMDRDTGRSRGFGFITYTSSEEASSAIQAMDGQVICYFIVFLFSVAGSGDEKCRTILAFPLN